MPPAVVSTSPAEPSASAEVSAPPASGPGDVLALKDESIAPEERHPATREPAEEEADLEAASTVCEAVDPDEREGARALDVEHVPVNDDPRRWPSTRKTAVLASVHFFRSSLRQSADLCSLDRTIAFTAMGGTISASVFFPALGSLQQELRASDSLVAASVSSFIAGQGVFPLLWSSLSEVTGRKKCYIVALGTSPRQLEPPTSCPRFPRLSLTTLRLTPSSSHLHRRQRRLLALRVDWRLHRHACPAKSRFFGRTLARCRDSRRHVRCERGLVHAS